MTAAPVVWNQLGPEASGLIRRGHPDVAVVDVSVTGEPRPEGPTADVLLAMPTMRVSGRPEAGADVAWTAGVPWVHLASAGLDLFPARLLEDRQVVTCSRGVTSPFIAEFALACMLAVEKSIPQVWDPDVDRATVAMGTLVGRTVGILGYGSIGSEVARRARAFGAEVIAARRTATTGAATDGTALAPAADVVAAADHLVVSVPATPATRHLLGAELLARCRPGTHLVNVARGWVIDHAALVEALRSGRVGAASLDVTDPEPLPADHPLWSLPNVRISPHVAWLGPRPIDAIVVNFVDNLARWRAGEPLNGVVDPLQGY